MIDFVHLYFDYLTSKAGDKSGNIDQNQYPCIRHCQQENNFIDQLVVL